MSVRREDSSSKPVEVGPVGCSWIPITPAKPNSTERLAPTEEAAQASPNWPRDFDLNSQFQSALACGGDIHNCAAGMPTNSPVNEESLIGNTSSVDLFPAMGKNAAVERDLADSDFARSSTSSCCVHPQFELEDRTDFHPRAEGMSSGNFLQRTVTDRSSVSGSSLDHTAPPTTITDAAVRKSIPQFEPVTPEKTSTGEYQQEHALKPSSIEETPAGKRNKTTMDDDKKKKKKSHLVDGQPGEVTPARLRENHKPDKGGREGADLVKTPSQKIKRKKHRPKVIIEGQKKNTPKRAKKVNAAEKTPQAKRKYARKNWATCPVGGGINGTDSDSKTPRSTGKPVGKRKTRTQGSSKEVDMDRETTESAEIQVSWPTHRSCRRSLNFDTNDDTVIDGISSECPSFNAKDQPETPHRTQETGVRMETNGRVIYHVYSRSKKRENFLSRTEQHPQSSLPSMNKDALKENGMLADQTTSTRRKGQIVFSDVTHDKEANSVQVGRNPDGPRTPKGTSDSKGSGGCLISEKQKRGLKRRRDETLEEAVSSAPILHCPVNYKKRRTVRVNRRVASSIQIEIQNIRDSWIKLFGSCCAQSQVTDLLSDKDATNGSQQVVEDLLPFETRERIRIRRSVGRTRRRQLASLIPEICKQWKKSPRRAAAKSRTQQNIEFLNEPPKCLEALAADNLLVKLARKKRSWRNTHINLRVLNMFNLQPSASASLGRPLAIRWKCVPPVDWIIDKLKKLDINAGSIASEGALVPYQNSGAVVPYDQARIRRQRPKVDLDDESLRVWTLLLENIDSEGIDGTNEENTKFWEEERRVFMGRAESFIARMHLVQGDRHFSPWKGSVVDSIVGVFLTQNVSDHLSSSAFMSLAAKYPAKRTNNSADLHDEGLGGDISESEICKLDSDETFGLTKEILNETVCGEYAKMLQEFEEERIREMNSLKHSQNAYWDDSVLEGNLRGPTDASLDPVISSEIIADRSVSSNEDGKHIEETLSSETPEISSQNSADSPIAQTTGTSDSCMLSTAEEETGSSFVKLLQMTGTVFQGIYGEDDDKRKLEERQYAPTESLACSLQKEDHLGNPTVPTKTIASCSQSSSCCVTNSGTQSTELLFQKDSKSSDSDSEKELCMAEINELSLESASGTTFQKATASSCEVQKLPTSIACSSSNEQIQLNQKKADDQRGQSPAQNKMQGVSEKSTFQQSMMDATGSSSNIDISKNSEHKEINSNATPEKNSNGPKSKGGKISKEKESPPVDWDQLRKEVELSGRKRERTARTLDSVDWDAVRCADVNEIAQIIKERGMNNILAARIKDFLNRVVKDHGSIDLEWLRDAPPDKAKEYLLSIKGLGLKSTECVRLLTLHHLAFPVDTNVGRIAVRLGWVPLQPLPEEVQLHLLELYPMMETIQKYLWPRLCKLVQKTLYELHYQMITFGKVFCTKSKPNCNACPMRAECRHFASAYASARLALPAPQDKSIVSAYENKTAAQNPTINTSYLQLPYAQIDEMGPKCGESNYLVEEPQTPEPVIEEPPTPEPDHTVAECDIEDAFGEDFGGIPTIQLNMTEFAQNLQAIVQQNTDMQDGEMSKALVALPPEAASIPAPKLKNVSHLRTEHQVYELPDSHQLLEGLDKREPDDPCPYLLAIWTPGETMDSIKPPEKRCSSEGLEKLCTDETCSSCNCTREAMSQTVRGTLLIPCRTAMRGSFPLNGTYFQVNEVFSDHESSLSPLNIPRTWLWNLPRRTVYFGTSTPSIFKGLTTEGIQYCFWRGFVCVRGFDRKTRAPRPLMARLHLSASKGKQLAKDNKAKIDKKNA